jgi:8-oxo-dGTP pyrophosphatase MutT (NUDIX family)
LKPLTSTGEYKCTKVKFTFYDGLDVNKFEPYTQSYAICFRDDGKIFIGFSPSEYNDWLLPGGTCEKGENGLATLRRELDEELSLEIKKVHLIGAQRVDYLNVKKESHYQLRYVAIVKAKKLTPDPDNGKMWKRKAINPKDFQKYLPWGNIGEHIVQKAVEWFNEQKMIEQLPYRQGVQAYIINDKDEVLLVCNVGDENFWKVPSGGKNQGESSRDTLHREIMEELGVKIKILKKCSFKNKFDWPEELIKKLGLKYKGQEQDIFIAELDKDPKIRSDPKEVKDYRWVRFDKINTILKLQHQQDMFKKVIKEYEKIRKK